MTGTIYSLYCELRKSIGQSESAELPIGSVTITFLLMRGHMVLFALHLQADVHKSWDPYV